MPLHDLSSPGEGGAVIFDVLLAADQASIDSNTILGGNIPNVFEHLCLVISTRTDRAATSDDLWMRFNNDSGANYHTQSMESVGTTSASQQFAGVGRGVPATVCAASSPANAFSPCTIDIADYLNPTNNKTFTAQSGYRTAAGAGGLVVAYRFGEWLSTAAITRITLLPGAGTVLKANTRATLLGIGL